jgi:hypothetical protein
VKVDGILKLKLPEEKPFPCRPDDPGISYKQKKLPDLRLKYNDQRNEANADELPEDLAQKLHLECLHNFPDNVKRDNADEDPYGCGTFNKVVYLV